MLYDLRNAGKLIAEERRQIKGWSQRRWRDELERVGFRCSDGYIGRVESGASAPSRKYLRAAEKALGKPYGTFLCHSVFDYVQQYCSGEGMNFQQFMEMFGMGLKSLVTDHLRPAPTRPLAQPRDPKDAPPGLTKEGRKRSLMTTPLHAMPA